jgi:hypothetical protein
LLLPSLLLLLLQVLFCHPLQQCLLLLLLVLRHGFPARCDVNSLTLLLLPQLLLHLLGCPMLLQMQRRVLVLCRMQCCYCCPLGI